MKAAQSQFETALAIFRKSIGASHHRYAVALKDYGELQLEMDQLKAASETLQEAVRILSSARKPSNDDVAKALIAQGLALARAGDPAAAEAQIRSAMATLKRILPPTHPAFAVAQGALSESLLAQGKSSEAERLLLESAGQLKNRLHYEQRIALERVIRFYELQHDAQATQRYQHELAGFERRVRAAAPTDASALKVTNS